MFSSSSSKVVSTLLCRPLPYTLCLPCTMLLLLCCCCLLLLCGLCCCLLCQCLLQPQPPHQLRLTLNHLNIPQGPP